MHTKDCDEHIGGDCTCGYQEILDDENAEIIADIMAEEEAQSN